MPGLCIFKLEYKNTTVKNKITALQLALLQNFVLEQNMHRYGIKKALYGFSSWNLGKVLSYLKEICKNEKMKNVQIWNQSLWI